MDDIVPLIIQAINQGDYFVLVPTGNSMRPLLFDNKSAVRIVGVPAGGLKRGDIALYQRVNGSYVLHRVVDVREGVSRPRLPLEDGYSEDRDVRKAHAIPAASAPSDCHGLCSGCFRSETSESAPVAHRVIDFCGDAQWRVERGIPEEAVIGVVSAFVRRTRSKDVGKIIRWTPVEHPAHEIYWRFWLSCRGARSVFPRAKGKVARMVRGRLMR